MLSRKIQQNVPLGSKVCFILKSGREISGSLLEIGRDYITVEENGSESTILVDMIGGWEVLKDESFAAEEEGEAKEPLTLEKHETTSPNNSISKTKQEDEKLQLPNDIQQRVLKKLLEIEANYQVKIQNAKISLVIPDFTMPENEIGKWNKNQIQAWNRIKNQYENARKINELSAKFGRIQPITNELKNLVTLFPTSLHLIRHLAYLYYLQGNLKEAFECFRRTAVNSSKKSDWYNFAVTAIESAKKELACFGLEQYFYKTSMCDETEAWYVYLSLLQEFNNFGALNTIFEDENRKFSEQDLHVLVETGIYFLSLQKGQEEASKSVHRWLEQNDIVSLIYDVFHKLDDAPVDSYKRAVMDFAFEEREKQKKKRIQRKQESKGYIYTFRRDRNFGFLRSEEGEQYFFHRSAVIDEPLLEQLYSLDLRKVRIPVVFETASGPKGPLAIKIAQIRTQDELFELASNYALEGDYAKAIQNIKRLLNINPEYPNANECYENWREFVRAEGIPRGSNLFARAKRVQLVEKDLERAVQLFREAIKRNDNAESAIKDLAQLLTQLGRPDEAIEIIEKNRKKVKDEQSLDNLAVTIYQKIGQYEEAITLLQRKLSRTSSKDKKAQTLWQIAASYLKAQNYAKSAEIFKEVLKLRPENVSAKRNIALCLLKQDRYDEAENLLNEIINISSDSRAIELLDVINKARTSGISADVDQIIIETTLSDFSSEISTFTKFFLDRCDFQGVPPDRVHSQEFRRSDLRQLEDLATQLGTRRPRDRAGYYLSAARIVISLDEEETSNQFYRYLCRSFASRGDASILENRHLDVAREWYREALRIYDGDRSNRKDEQDAVNALVRFIFSTLGQAQIPMTPKIPSIDETIEEVITRHPKPEKAFNAIANLVLSSQYAANRILNRLFSRSTLQAMSLDYLRDQGIFVPETLRHLDDFVNLWNELRRKRFEGLRNVSNELHFILNIELSTAWLSNIIERIKGLGDKLFYDLDQQRIRFLQSLLETAFDLCKQVSFEEQERLCIQLDSRCQEFLREVEESPTRLSIEEIYPVIEIIQEKVKARLEGLYETAKPQLTLRLAVESYPNNQNIEIQIVIANKIGSSPAESLELIIPEQDEELFTLNVAEIQLDESLRGGDQKILRVPLSLSETAMQSQTFSLSVYAQYRTRLGEIEQSSIESFSVRLYSEEEFEEIENPYATYAEGGIVGDPEMFYGREELIFNVAKAVRESRSQSKCIITFGQKRAGKSSILFHLKQFLQKDKNLIIVDIGNIGSLLDPYSSVPFLYQILWIFLKELKDSILSKIEEGFSEINLSFPNDQDFFNHPSPLIYFKEVFKSIQRACSKHEDWKNIRIILLVDEFSYIYEFIASHKIPESFMKNWKAILQENYFNAVLAGQDVMPKFKQKFPNEFGTTQDERVSYLKIEDAVKLIDEPIRIGGKQGKSRFREKAIDRIIDLTAGSPFYIQIICNRLVEYMNRKKAGLVTEADVEQIKNELIRGVNALSQDKFDNLINSGDTTKDAISDEDALKVLKAIAANSLTGPANRNNIICETHSPVDLILDDLVKREVVEREREHYYKIRVGLFKEWLNANL